MKRLITFCVLFFLCFQIGNAQTDVKKHTVSRGETIIEIANNYNVTPYDLLQANSATLNSAEDLKENDVLIIPDSNTKTPKLESASDASPSSERTNPFTYTVIKGDTKFSLAKRFGMSISKLEALNPHIVSGLNEGHVLKLNTSVETITEEPTKTKIADSKSNITISETQNDPLRTSEASSKDTYTIIYGDTKYSLAKKYALTVKELERLNPHIVKTLRPGDVIRFSTDTESTTLTKPALEKAVLSSETAEQIPSETVVPADSIQSTTTVKEEPVKMPKDTNLPKEDSSMDPKNSVVSMARYDDLSKTMITSKPKKLLFVLPFNDLQFNEEASGNFSTDSDAFKKEHFEFYSGAKIAMDSLKKLGLIVTSNILEGENAKQDSKLIDAAKAQQLNSYDAIILPFYDHVEEDISSLVSEQNTPVVTATTIAHQQNGNNLFAAMPSVNDQRSTMLNFMISKQANIIVVSDVDRSESRAFIADYASNAQFVTMRKNGTFKDEDLISLLKPNQLNYVILDSDRNSIFLNVTNILLSELNRFELQLAVLETDLIPNTDEVSAKRYRILKMLFPSISSLETKEHLAAFSKTYKKVYNLDPSTNAVLGFDITFDTVLRLSQTRSFEESAKTDITEYVKLKFVYMLNPMGGYHNKGIYILQYDTDANLREAK